MNVEAENICLEAAKHKRFTDQDINNYWKVRAENYARDYTSTFGFMTDMKSKVLAGATLSPKQLAAILNCARKEGEAMILKEPLEITLEDVSFNLPNEIVDVIEGSLPGDNEAFPVVESNTLHFKSLTEIETRMRELELLLVTIQEGVAPVQAEIDASVFEEKALFDAFQAQVEAMRAARSDLQSKLFLSQDELKKIGIELENQRRLHNLTIQQIAAEQKFQELKGQFDELRSQMPWSDVIADYQWDDVCFQAAAFKAGKKGILNANPMGGGKTFESGAFEAIGIPLFQEMYGRFPRSIWFTKKSLRHSSFKELRRWNPDRMIIVLDGTPSQRDFQVDLAVANNAMVIANYDMMNTTPKIKEFEWDFVFMDEVHKLKGGANSTPTRIFENAKEICHKAKFIVPMSGSPIQNHPKEMWTYLHLLDPEHFPNVRRFEREFCYGYGERDSEGNLINVVDWERIIGVLKDRVIRRDKKEIDPQLPDKVREFRLVDMAPKQREIYNQLKQEFFVWLDEQKSQSMTATAIIAQLTRLRQINLLPSSVKIKDEKTGLEYSIECNDSGKLDEAMDIVEQLVGENEQVVIFSSQFNAPLFELERRIKEEFKVTTECVTGENSGNIEDIENRFQQGETRILLINMKTGSEGLNLQKFPDRWPGGASHVIFLDLWWNPESNKQGEDRIWRKGQTETANIHIIQTENSVDAFIANILEEKEEMIEGITNRSEYKKNASDWKELLEDLI